MATVYVVLKDGDNNIMAEYTSNPTDGVLNTAIFCFAEALNYQDKLLDGSDNPESKGSFLIRKMKEYAENVIISQAANDAAQAARDTVLANKITL